MARSLKGLLEESMSQGQSMFTGPQLIARQASALAMTPELRRAISLLKLSNSELTKELLREAAVNPALTVSAPTQDVTLNLWKPPSGVKPRPPQMQVGIGGGLGEALGVAGSPGLQEHILHELRLVLRDPEDLAIGEALAEAVSPWGWLDRSVGEVAEEIQVPAQKVEVVLSRVQEIEPAGLFARDLRECLWLQAQDRDLLSPVMACLLNNLPLLAEGGLTELARLSDATEDEIRAHLALIRNFDPKPGLRFDPASPPPSEPDIIVRRERGGWRVSLNNSTLPEIDINNRAKHGSEDLRAAELLRRAVVRRNETLLHLATEIVQCQSGWLEAGPARLAPMSFSSLAAALGLHETTVGRLAAGRMMATPRGTVTLRALCSASIATQNGEHISAVALRHRIAAMIAQEGSKPLNDVQIVENLADAGILLARRTVAKYRSQMGIPNASVREEKLGSAGA